MFKPKVFLNQATKATENILTMLAGNVLTEPVRKVLDIYTLIKEITKVCCENYKAGEGRLCCDGLKEQSLNHPELHM